MNQYTLKLNAPLAKKELAPLFGLVNYSTVLPILEDVFIKRDGDKTIFTATDLETSVTIGLFCETSMNGEAICFPAREMRKLLTNSLSDEVCFSGDKQKVVVDSAGFKAKLQLQDALNFPKEPILENPISLKVDAAKFNRLMSNALRFASNDDLRPAMTGIYMHEYEGKIFVVATDAHRLYWDELMDAPTGFKGNYIIRTSTIETAIKAIKSGGIDISFYNNQYVKIEQADKRIIGRLIEANYPNYRIVLNRYELRFNLKRKNFVAFLKLAATFTNKSTKQIGFELSGENIYCKGEDADFSVSFDYALSVYNINKKVDKIKFALNIDFLQEALKINSKDEYVVIEHSESSTKSLVVDDCIILMPLMPNQ